MSRTSEYQDMDELDQVGLDTNVELELVDSDGHVERLTFDLVRDEYADLAHGFLGAGAPLAKAILGKRVNARVPYAMGDIRQVRILRIRPAQKIPSAATAERRQAMLDEARRKAERTSAEMFAASYDGKWGDYDMAEDESEKNQNDG